MKQDTMTDEFWSDVQQDLDVYRMICEDQEYRSKSEYETCRDTLKQIYNDWSTRVTKDGTDIDGTEIDRSDYEWLKRLMKKHELM